jgi:hypothetical protein
MTRRTALVLTILLACPGAAAVQEGAGFSVSTRKVAYLAPDAGPGWKAGLAQVDITPERPVFLAGYASRNKPFATGPHPFSSTHCVA